MRRLIAHSPTLALASVPTFALVLGACVLERVDLCAEDPTRPGCGDAGPDAAYGCAEGDPCPSHVPVCNAGLCIGCDGNEDCARFGEGSKCNAAGACVTCLDASECASDQACVAGTCAADCVAHADCAGRADRPSCDVKTGDCVGCTPDSEEVACGLNSCDPSSLQCTSTPRGSRGLCMPCVADSECATIADTGTLRCVELHYESASRGRYCLVDRSTTSGGICPNRFAEPIEVSSVGGVAATYCFPPETLTTCEAILDFGATGCDSDAQCGADDLGSDGLCRDDGAGKMCTYGCGRDIDCPAGFVCNDSGATSYCCTGTSSVGCT